MPVMLGMAEGVCTNNAFCQASPSNPNSNGDPDSDGKPTIESAWAGIAVVIVAFVVAIGVWCAVRRRRRARGGHSSVDVGQKGSKWSFGRGFWRRRSAAKSEPAVVDRDMELVEDEEAKRRRPSSSVSNFKRTTTLGTTETDPTHAAKLNAQLPGTDAVELHPMTHPPVQAEVVMPQLPESLPLNDLSRTARPSTSSSIRSSLSRLSIPPPGLGFPTGDGARPQLAQPPPAHVP